MASRIGCLVRPADSGDRAGVAVAGAPPAVMTTSARDALPLARPGAADCVTSLPGSTPPVRRPVGSGSPRTGQLVAGRQLRADARADAGLASWRRLRRPGQRSALAATSARRAPATHTPAIDGLYHDPHGRLDLARS